MWRDNGNWIDTSTWHDADPYGLGASDIVTEDGYKLSIPPSNATVNIIKMILAMFEMFTITTTSATITAGNVT